MRTCKVGNIEIGRGIPKICIPIVEKSRDEIIKYAQKIKKHNPDIVEWRADFYEEVFNIEDMLEVAKDLKKQLKNIALLFTIRRKNEGGNLDIESDKYLSLVRAMSKSKNIDIVDVDISSLRREDRHIIYEIKDSSKLLISYHNFKHTPSVEAMKKILLNMNYYKPDIYKLAVMPLNKSDNINVLKLAVDAEQNLERPIVIISMGKMGVASRICGEIFSSSISFASLEKSSAPGQIEIDELREVLEIIHKNYTDDI